MRKLLNQFPKRSAEQWIVQGLIEMEHTSFINLKVEILAENLGLTRGSFYHHFKNKDDYLKQVLNFWKKETTEKGLSVIPFFKGSLRDKLRQTEIFLHHSNILNIEKSIRQSLSSELIKSYLKKMDPIRINLMVKFFLDEGYSLKDAQFKSKMIYNIQIADLISFNNSNHEPLPLSELEERLDFYLT